ncbi:exonuclease/endonuclease/phosphatase family protein [Cellulomonas palmilytica]|uniref:hypothetical protein n=1 Tax=Cellulomonas palmilytica TaxID=2608402 RepID=UPI001F2B8E1E|nr:hypothetical protein [Cellulomonas palmilytica]UJP41328.1 hypothetical protein F1D97_07865 [Cellulomonas palmilytica]
MTLNIAGALPDFGGDPGVEMAWRERYARIGAGLQEVGWRPDIIALQEVTARKGWFGAGDDPDDYEAMQVLIRGLKDAVGVDYRIAYLGAVASNHPGLVQGQAVLYNAARLRNITAPGMTSVLEGDKQPEVLGVYPRKSYPCTPSQDAPDACALLDGAGLFWTSVFFRTDVRKRTFESGHVRFAFVADGEQFTFYNVHLHPRIVDGAEVNGAWRALLDLVERVEAHPYSTRVYPPIVAGDFNGGVEGFPSFRQIAPDDASDPLRGNDMGIDFVIAGTRTGPPTTAGTTSGTDQTDYRYEIRATRTAILPEPDVDDPDGLCAPLDVAWSDHCAVLVQIEPAT